MEHLLLSGMQRRAYILTGINLDNSVLLPLSFPPLSLLFPLLPLYY